MPSEDVIGQKLSEWTAGQGQRQAMLTVFYKIRDIPYGILPELNSPSQYLRILETNMGS
jgi:hypothetical protein